MTEATQPEPSTPQISLTAKYIPLVAPFMGVHDLRWYIRGINVQPHKDGGVVIAATNGSMLALAYDREGSVDQEYILHVDPRTVATCAGRKPNMKLVLLNSRLTVISDLDELSIQPGDPFIDGKFPKYDNIIPKNECLKSGLIGDFNPAYISTISKAISTACKSGIVTDKKAAATFFNSAGNPNLPSIARIIGFDNFMVVLMPMRHEPIDRPIPLWVPVSASVDDIELSVQSTATEPEKEAA